MAPKAPPSESSSQSSPVSTACGGRGVSSASHSVAKRQPIIRVVHIYAPKLITTDPANFRALVQKLTGNHADEEADEDLICANDGDNQGKANNQENSTLPSNHHKRTPPSTTVITAPQTVQQRTPPSTTVISAPQTEEQLHKESLSHCDLYYEAELAHHDYRIIPNDVELASNDQSGQYSSTASWDSSTTASFEEGNSLFNELEILSGWDSTTPLLDPQIMMASAPCGLYYYLGE